MLGLERLQAMTCSSSIKGLWSISYFNTRRRRFWEETQILVSKLHVELTKNYLLIPFMELMKIQLYFHTVYEIQEKNQKRKNEKNQALGRADFGSNKLFPIYRYVFLSRWFFASEWYGRMKIKCNKFDWIYLYRKINRWFSLKKRRNRKVRISVV